MRICITGATGFLGSHLVPVLLEQRHSVIATYRDSAKAKAMDWTESVEWVQCDLFDLPENPFMAFGKPEAMMHLAWGELPDYKNNAHLARSLPAHSRFLRAMIDGGLKHLLVAGTCLEYGMVEGKIDESTPLVPHTPYGQAKARLYQEIMPYCEKNGIIFQWARLFYMYGNGQPAHTFFSQLEKAITQRAQTFDMSGGQQIRDFLNVSDVAKALTAIVLQDQINGPINICSGREITLENLAKEYLQQRHAQLELNLGVYPYPDWEPFRFWGNDAKLREILESA